MSYDTELDLRADLDEAQDTIKKLLARELDLLCEKQKMQAKYEKLFKFTELVWESQGCLCSCETGIWECIKHQAKELLKELEDAN